MGDKSAYIVRGAKMQCSCGTHKRKINLPTSHGSYVNGKPMMNKNDNVVEINVPYMGICTGGCQVSAQVVLIGEHGETLTGKRCIPMILKKWMNTKENTLVDGKPALTTKSQLICAYGGVITFVTDGQHEK